MNFNRVNIEVTNICGLSCSFCPPKLQATQTMTDTFFESIIVQLKPYTKILAFHVMGDPLTLSNLDLYLDLAFKHQFSVELTTSGYYINKKEFKTLFHPAVRQLNISLNSYNKNSINMSFDEYINNVLKVCKEKIKNYPKPFINLRLWNIDDAQSESAYNNIVFNKLSDYFDLDLYKLNEKNPKSIRVASKVLLNFDRYFEWPSLKSNNNSDGSCYGLKSHIGILANGTVVPCCLDGEGIINLGNLHDKKLEDILTSPRAIAMIEGFLNYKAVEELCKKCTYKDRFNTDN